MRPEEDPLSQPLRAAPPRLLRRLSLVGLLSGCTVTTYQPMSGLHRPVAINLDAANFEGLSVHLRCLPGPVVSPAEARDQCRKLSRLFENQGAVVDSRITEGRDPAAVVSPDAAPRGPGLQIRLTARLIHLEETSLLWWSYATDYTFAQDIEVRDETGFLLIRDSLTGRFVRSYGFTSEAPQAFSRDYYRQLSQLALNARVRRDVLVDRGRD